jgi:hypothetical protein
MHVKTPYMGPWSFLHSYIVPNNKQTNPKKKKKKKSFEKKKKKKTVSVLSLQKQTNKPKK